MQNNSNDRNNERSHEEKHSQGWNEERNMSNRNNNSGDGREDSQRQSMGSRGSGMNDTPMNDDLPYSRGSMDARSDNDDFNDSGFDDESREATSRTFNEDEDTWEQEQRMQGLGPNSDSYSNQGTRNNNWDANDQTQRTSGIHDDEQRDMSSHGRYSNDEQNRYGQENDRRNREELEE